MAQILPLSKNAVHEPWQREGANMRRHTEGVSGEELECHASRLPAVRQQAKISQRTAGGRRELLVKYQIERVSVIRAVLHRITGAITDSSATRVSEKIKTQQKKMSKPTYLSCQ